VQLRARAFALVAEQRGARLLSGITRVQLLARAFERARSSMQLRGWPFKPANRVRAPDGSVLFGGASPPKPPGVRLSARRGAGRYTGPAREVLRDVLEPNDLLHTGETWRGALRS
jgi:hypothetical protein